MDSMVSIGEILLAIGNTEKKFKSERAEIISELYDMYKRDNKKQNWLNYVRHLKANRIKDSKETRTKFQSSKMFFKEKSIQSFCFFLSHIPTKDLYYLTSEARDKFNRGESFVKWLFWSIKVKK